MGGTADIDRPPAPIASEAYDPEPTSTGFAAIPEPLTRPSPIRYDVTASPG
jgi:hypothetical protein